MECQSYSLTTVPITANLQIRVVPKRILFMDMQHCEIVGFVCLFSGQLVISEPSKTRGMVLFCPCLNCLKSTHCNLAGEFSYIRHISLQKSITALGIVK